MYGTLADSRYTIGGLLGSGGMGEVYLARDKALGRDVALKVLREQYSGSEEFKVRFRHEAENAASLSHPNVVTVYDRGEDPLDGTPYIAMEYLKGGTLADRLARKGPLDPYEAARIARQIALALGHAHAHGVIHRDVKPHNVFMTGEYFDTAGAVKVGDFGIARATEATAMTETSFVIGSVRYLSPEQAMGEPVGPRSDLYSLGVVLYQMLTGRVPFDAEGPITIAIKHITEAPAPPKESDPRIPEGLEAVTLKLLSKDPASRYADASSLIEDLERVSRGLRPRAAVASRAPREAPTKRLKLTITPPKPERTERDLPFVAGSRRLRRWGLKRRVAGVTMISVSTLVLAAGGASAGLYEVPPWLPEEVTVWLEKGLTTPSPEEEAILPNASEEQPEEAPSEQQRVVGTEATTVAPVVSTPSPQSPMPEPLTNPTPQPLTDTSTAPQAQGDTVALVTIAAEGDVPTDTPTAASVEGAKGGSSSSETAWGPSGREGERDPLKSASTNIAPGSTEDAVEEAKEAGEERAEEAREKVEERAEEAYDRAGRRR